MNGVKETELILSQVWYLNSEICISKNNIKEEVYLISRGDRREIFDVVRLTLIWANSIIETNHEDD